MSEQEPVGSLAEELARLQQAIAEALPRWVVQGGPGTGLGSSLGAGLGQVFGARADSGACAGSTGQGTPCGWCPLCRTLWVLREAGPDAGALLARAASLIVQAVGLIAEAATTGRAAQPVTRIRVSDETPGAAPTNPAGDEDDSAGWESVEWDSGEEWDGGEEIPDEPSPESSEDEETR